ncbi:MAG: amidohydrolase family protein, partial [Verrucomicrobiales bacterium]
NRAKKIADEFKIRRVIVDKGYGYRLRKPLKNADLVVSLAFPDAPLVSDPDRALDISLERLQHWELAPTNPGVLQDNNVRFALSPHQLGDELGKFWPNLRKAIQHGLKEETALASLTSVPARLLGEEDRLGEIGNGCLANLVVTDGNPFRNKDARIRQVWIDGKPWLDELDHRKTNTLGTWQASWTGAKGPERFKITGTEKKLKLNVEGNETEKATEVDLNLSGRDELTFTLPSKVFGITPDGMVRLSAYLNTKTIVGQGVLPDGQRFSWSAIRGEDPPPASEEPSALAAIETEAFDQYPAGAYPGRFPGLSQRKRRIFIENATVWTCGPQGILLEANVIIEDGRIVALGRDIKPLKNSYTIDGRGKHITPGLVDCHSHTAISRGVNEGSHAVTCEVGVGDVVDPTDISIYRQLAGGLTTAN